MEPQKKRRIRALVVDDTPDVAESFAALLKVLGHEAEAITDPRKVLNVAVSSRPDITFVDIEMPFLNGFTVARQLRAHFSLEEMCIVAITGHGDAASRTHSRQAGIDAHLTKPATIELIERTIEQVCPQLNRRE